MMGALLGVALAVSASSGQTTDGQPMQDHYTILDERGVYELIWRERQPPVPDFKLILRSQGDDRPDAGPYAFNWIAR